MKRLVILLCVVLVVPSVLLAIDAYPKTQLGEDVTATWCGYCPDAYAGLDVCHADYDWLDFISVRYYATSGDLGTAETDARIAYYGVTGYPTVIFNGLTHVVGGGAGIATGTPYKAIIDAAYFDPSPVKVTIDSFDTATGDVQVTVTMVSETENLSGDHMRLILLEDRVPDPGSAEIFNHVTRDIINTTINLTGAGNTAVFNETFVVDPGFDPAQMWAVAFVQRNADKAMLQAATTHAGPAYKARAVVPFARTMIGPSSGEYSSEKFGITNLGTSDTYQIDLVVDDAPAGWTFEYCDALDACTSIPQGFSLANDEQAEFYVKLTPDSLGQASYHVEISSPNLTTPITIDMSYLTAGFDVLIIDDDGGETFETYFTAALDAAGKTYGMWDLSTAKLTDGVAANYDILVWNVGWAFPSLDVEDRAFLEAYLDSGKSLFITGQDVGWDLNANADNADVVFYRNYLGANYLSDDTNNYVLAGAAGDPITDGLNLSIIGGDGASNQEYPSAISAYDADSTPILTYSTSAVAAVRSTDSTSGAKVVYLAFGFEAVDNATDRADLLGAAIDWLAPEVVDPNIFIDGFEAGDTSAWSAAVP